MNLSLEDNANEPIELGGWIGSLIQRVLEKSAALDSRTEMNATACSSGQDCLASLFMESKIKIDRWRCSFGKQPESFDTRKVGNGVGKD